MKPLGVVVYSTTVRGVRADARMGKRKVRKGNSAMLTVSGTDVHPLSADEDRAIIRNTRHTVLDHVEEQFRMLSCNDDHLADEVADLSLVRTCRGGVRDMSKYERRWQLKEERDVEGK